MQKQDLDRAQIIHQQFLQRVRDHDFPSALSLSTPEQAQIDKNFFLDLFDSQLASRHLDFLARQLKLENKGFYSIGSSGHEANAAVAAAFQIKDMAFLHYRSGAFFVQRAKQQQAKENAIRNQLLGICAAAADPLCQGRHKVYGSVELNIPPQTSTIASHLPKAVGCAMSINLAKSLKYQAKLAHDSVVLCSFGDASLNHSTALGALNTALWLSQQKVPLPIVFICEDNGFGISAATPNDWIKTQWQDRPGLHYLQADGCNLVDVYQQAKQAEHIARIEKQAVFLHIKTVRLMGHAGTDIELYYRSVADVEKTEAQDPLLHSARILQQDFAMTSEEIIQLYQQQQESIQNLYQELDTKPLADAKAISANVIPATKGIELPAQVDTEQRVQCFGTHFQQLSEPRNMAQSLNYALTDILLRYNNTVVFGEDIAANGGVYRVTADLLKRFGKKRVFDSVLDEQAILGTAIGLSHNGFLPIPEIQFLAYVHNAEDQIRGEIATLPFFSNGQFANPMVIRIASFAYQKGFGGHFHNDNAFAFIREIPGLIIACPAHAADAAPLLKKCVELAYKEQRVVIFLEPIALYMTRDLHQKNDQLWLSVYDDLPDSIELDDIEVYGVSNEMVIITYANGYYLSRQAEQILKTEYNIECKVINLRWLAPLAWSAIIDAIKDAKKILIVDECRQTGSLSEQLVCGLVERLQQTPDIKRLCAADSFIPLGPAAEHILPSKQQIIETIIQWFKQGA